MSIRVKDQTFIEKLYENVDKVAINVEDGEWCYDPSDNTARNEDLKDKRSVEDSEHYKNEILRINSKAPTTI